MTNFQIKKSNKLETKKILCLKKKTNEKLRTIFVLNGERAQRFYPNRTRQRCPS
jgi:hypothetical protein